MGRGRESNQFSSHAWLMSTAVGWECGAQKKKSIRVGTSPQLWNPWLGAVPWMNIDRQVPINVSLGRTDLPTQRVGV